MNAPSLIPCSRMFSRLNHKSTTRLDRGATRLQGSVRLRAMHCSSSRRSSAETFESRAVRADRFDSPYRLVPRARTRIFSSDPPAWKVTTRVFVPRSSRRRQIVGRATFFSVSLPSCVSRERALIKKREEERERERRFFASLGSNGRLAVL